jgi:hypothetical protein
MIRSKGSCIFVALDGPPVICRGIGWIAWHDDGIARPPLHSGSCAWRP